MVDYGEGMKYEKLGLEFHCLFFVLKIHLYFVLVARYPYEIILRGTPEAVNQTSALSRESEASLPNVPRDSDNRLDKYQVIVQLVFNERWLSRVRFSLLGVLFQP